MNRKNLTSEEVLNELLMDNDSGESDFEMASEDDEDDTEMVELERVSNIGKLTHLFHHDTLIISI